MLRSGGLAGDGQFVFDSDRGFLTQAAASPADFITVPDAHLLFEGEYKRSGNDLKLLGEDGQSFYIPDYFKSDNPATLLSPDGAALTPDVVEALAGPLAPGQYAQAGGSSAAAAAIGRVAKVDGSASVVRNGVTITVNVGDGIVKGDVAQTGANSALAIIFIDGTTFSMTSNARMVLNDFVYSPNATNNSALINLVQGSITFLAGQVAKTGDMRVETPVATMGIRGTAVLTEIDVNLGTTRVQVLVERDGTTGSFNLYNKATGALMGTVSQSGIGWVVTPTGVQQLQLSPTELQQSLFAVQQVFQDRDVGNQILQQNPADPNTPNPNRTDNSNGTNGSSTPPPVQTIILVNGQGPGGTPTTTVVTVTFSNLPPPPLPQNSDEVPQPLPDPIVDTNRAPVLKGETTRGAEDHQISLSKKTLLQNASDPDGDSLTLSAVGGATNGTVAIVGDKVVFTPAANYFGPASYTYTVSDGLAETTATVTLSIGPVNDAPVATADFNDVTEAGAGTFGDPFALGNVLNNDTDVDHGTTKKVIGVAKGKLASASGSVSYFIDGTYGVLLLLSNGQYLYTLNNLDGDTQKLDVGETGVEIFTYTMRDEHGATSTTTLTFNIAGTNDSPVITGQSSGTVTEDGTTTISGDLDVTDVDADDAAGTWSMVERSGQELSEDGVSVVGRYGALSVDQDGEWTFVLDNESSDVQALRAGQQAQETFTVRVTDDHGASDAKNVTIRINGTNDAPTFTGSALGTAFVPGGDSVAIAIDVQASDIDSANYNGGSLMATVTDGGGEGDTLSIANNDFITIVGASVMFDADGEDLGFNPVEIGTVTDNINSLTVNLNANADDAVVKALTQAISFENTKDDPTAGTRTVTFTLRDGDGTANGGQNSTSFEAMVDLTAPPDNGEGFFGHSFKYQYFYPTSNSLYGDFNITVTDAIELPDMTGRDNVGSADFTSDQIIFDFSQSSSWNSGSFNGFRVSDLNDQLSDIVSVRLNAETNMAGLTDSNIDLLDPDHFQLNWQGLSFDAQTKVVLDVVFV